MIFGTDPDPANFDRSRSWTIELWESLEPYAMEGAYVNFSGDQGRERARPSYGESYDRLADVKATYDPDNVFHVNQNIEPAR